MTKVALYGALGRVGSEVALRIGEQADMELVAAIERPDHAGIGSRLGRVTVTSADRGVDADVMVDFTVPEVTLRTARRAVERSCALVVATTGFRPEQLNELHGAADKIPLLVAPNLSLGVNVLYDLVREAAKKLGAYDVEILEMHHRGKRDAPSGTAHRLAEILESIRPEATRRYGREGITGERPRVEIGIHALRGGDVTGEHRVIFAGEGERLELSHQAGSRRAFAAGALAAIRFVAARPAGLYDMRDVLRL